MHWFTCVPGCVCSHVSIVWRIDDPSHTATLRIVSCMRTNRHRQTYLLVEDCFWCRGSLMWVRFNLVSLSVWRWLAAYYIGCIGFFIVSSAHSGCQTLLSLYPPCQLRVIWCFVLFLWEGQITFFEDMFDCSLFCAFLPSDISQVVPLCSYLFSMKELIMVKVSVPAFQLYLMKIRCALSIPKYLLPFGWRISSADTLFL